MIDDTDSQFGIVAIDGLEHSIAVVRQTELDANDFLENTSALPPIGPDMTVVASIISLLTQPEP